jgi:tetratricopeptide (TPR) repeat protein
VLPTARPAISGPKPVAINPTVTAKSPAPTGARPVVSGPKPLLTNPRPTATATAARSVSSPAHLHHGGSVAALAAASGKSQAEVALFLYSQRNSHSHWGWGGWGGWGWGGGYGYGPAFGSYGFSPFGFMPWGYGSGFNVGFGYHSGPWSFGLGYGFGYSPAISYVPVYAEPPVIVGDSNPPLLPVPDSAPVPAAAPDRPAAEPGVNFAERGQELFLAGKYDEAVKALRHAVLDDPKNGPLLALTGEALWAAGSYNEAAGAIQQSLLATPEADWVGVSSRAARLIPAEAVGALAKALGEKELPEMRFLAAYQSFGAGKYEEATGHLDVLLKAAPDDQVGKKLREQAVKLGEGK